MSFDRLDECLPFPIPDEARSVVQLFPPILELSQYTLKVSGLPSGRYTIEVNGKPLATLSTEELAAGANLTSFCRGPIADQGKAILMQVGNKESLVSQWRGLSRMGSQSNAPASLAQQLDKLRKSIEEADARIRREAKPRRLHFRVVPLG